MVNYVIKAYNITYNNYFGAVVGLEMLRNKLKEIRMKEYFIDNKSEFARFLGVPVHTYIKWENSDTIPNLDSAMSVAVKLNRTVYDIWYQE